MGEDAAGSSLSRLPHCWVLQALPQLELLLTADPAVLRLLRHYSAGWLRRLRWPDAPIADAVLALNAAVTNSVQHAYRAPGGGDVSVHALAAGSCPGLSAARFTVHDWGRWRSRDLSLRGSSSSTGYGMALMDVLSEDLYVETGAEGTTVVLTTPVIVIR
jgi:serine/threonine-protein kinase RsbW